MDRKPISKGKLRATLSLSLAGLFLSVALICLEPSVAGFWGAALSLVCCGSAIYNYRSWRQHPSTEPESTAEATRNKTAFWMGVFCSILFFIGFFLVISGIV